MLDYDTLRIIWWLLLGILIIGFAIMDGFDLGVAMILPFVAKTDSERRVTINTVGPVWEGNQVWLVLGGGAIFAAWPYVYAVAFSGFYLAMMIVLMGGFILRPLGFKYRSKVKHHQWRFTWDKILCISGLVPTLIFGVAIGNVLQGVPFHFDITLRDFYTGTFFGLLNPFALLCGFVSVTMLCMHGSLYLASKTEYAIRERAVRIARVAALLLIILFSLAGLWIAFGIDGYLLKSSFISGQPSNPLHKTVILATGAWLHNYALYPWMKTAPILGILASLGAFIFARKGQSKFAFCLSSLSIFGIISSVGLSMFPFILPSSTNPGSSLLVWDASSSQYTLQLMLIATVIFLPIIIAYTVWVYRILRGKVTEKYIEDNHETVY